MITKEDVEATVNKATDGTKKEMREQMSSMKKELKEDIENAVAQIVETVMKFTASKEDLKHTEERLNVRLDKVEGKLEKVEVEVKDVKRQINDLKADTPTPRDFSNHEERIKKLEGTVFPS